MALLDRVLCGGLGSVGNLANYRRRLAIVLSSATIWAIGCVWLVFHQRALEALGQNPIFAVAFVCFCAASIYFLYFVAKRKPGFELGLTVLAVNLTLLSVNSVASLVLNLQNFWTETIQILNRVLLPLGTAILFWQGVKKSKEEKRRQAKKMEIGE
jgi:hypothetical protein